MKKKIITILLTICILFSGCVHSASALNSKHYKLIKHKIGGSVDMVQCIDRYKPTKWFCYYVYANGDIYILTIKKNKITVFYQLN